MSAATDQGIFLLGTMIFGYLIVPEPAKRAAAIVAYIALVLLLLLTGCAPARAEDRTWRDYAAEHRAWNKAQAETAHQNHAETQRLLRPQGAGTVPPYYLPTPPPVRRLEPQQWRPK